MGGLVRSELGHTGSTTSLGSYFLEDKDGRASGFKGSWWKVGSVTSTAKKNPLSDAQGVMNSFRSSDLLDELSKHERSLTIRMTGDDLPQPTNRVVLDETYVDEYGLPVARIERKFGPNEDVLFKLTGTLFQEILDPFPHLIRTGRAAFWGRRVPSF